MRSSNIQNDYKNPLTNEEYAEYNKLKQLSLTERKKLNKESLYLILQLRYLIHFGKNY